MPTLLPRGGSSPLPDPMLNLRLFSPLSIALLALAGLVAALLAQHVFEMMPCPWCILQRMALILVLACAVGGHTLRARSPLSRLFVAMSGVFSLLGAASAEAQLRAIKTEGSCAASSAQQVLDATRLAELMPSVFRAYGACSSDLALIMGVPMVYLSGALFALCGVIAGVYAMSSRAPKKGR